MIVSIDTLKIDRYRAHLTKQHWDAVVIDESHNVTNDSTQNNRLARCSAAAPRRSSWRARPRTTATPSRSPS